MPHDAFISYASKDKAVADAVCAILEAERVRCWIAPRDVTPGLSYGGAISDAVSTSRVLVLVFSSASNQSDHVKREIERAVSKGIPIVPFRIEDVIPSGDMEYFISSCHWLDALTAPIENHIRRLAGAIHSLLGASGHVPSSAQVADAPPAVRRRSRRWGKPILALAGLALLAIAAFCFFFSERSEQSVELVGPADGTLLVGGVPIYRWKPKDASDLEFELERKADDGPVLREVVLRNSYTEDRLSGRIQWRLRALLPSADRERRPGPWTPWRSIEYYADALHKIRATGRVHVGVAEEDDIYVRRDADHLTGLEVELVKSILSDDLHRTGHGPEIEVDYTYAEWGDAFFHLLDDRKIDLLISGISIREERERRYGIVFSDPYVEYPNCILFRKGEAPVQGGRIALRTLGAGKATTNADVACRLLGEECDTRLRTYEGSNLYVEMMNDLVSHRLDGVVMDEPYAIRHRALFASQGHAFDMIAIGRDLLDPAPVERIGMAVRTSDTELLDVINGYIHAHPDRLDALRREFLPREP